jgi:hypothetical protein
MKDLMDLKVCPKCGNTTDAANEICPYCGYAIKKSSHPAPGTPLTSPVARPEIVPVPGDHVLSLAHSPFAAAICSALFIGWGQWYNGRMWDGIRFIAVFLISAFLFIILELIIRVSAFAFVLYFFFFFVMTGAWIFGIDEAWETAKKINSGEIVFARKSRLFWLPVALYIILIGIAMLAIISAYVSGKDFIPQNIGTVISGFLR